MISELRFIVKGIPLNVKVDVAAEGIYQFIDTHTMWHAMRSNSEKIVSRRKQQQFSLRVLHAPVFSLYRPVYYGTLIEGSELCQIEGRFLPSTVARAGFWLGLLFLSAWLILSIVRFVRFGLLSEQSADIFGFLLFLLAAVLFVILFFIVLFGLVRMYQLDVDVVSNWLNGMEAKVAAERTRPNQDQSETE